MKGWTLSKGKPGKLTFFRRVMARAFATFIVLYLMQSGALVVAQTATAISTPEAPASRVSATPSMPTAPAKPVAAVVSPLKVQVKPLWTELTPVQQQSLKPLEANWSNLGDGQKRKWLEVSKNYQSLPAPEQAKMHSRMAEWVALSQQQRAQARLNFAETKTLTASEKAANWKAYQALSADEKQKLASQAEPKPNSAAVAVKPVAPHKLASVPVTRKTIKDSDHLAESAHGANQHTVFPLPASPPETPPVQKN